MTTANTLLLLTAVGYVSYLDKEKQISSKFVENRRPCLVGLCVIIIFLKTNFSLPPVVFDFFYFILLTFKFLVSFFKAPINYILRTLIRYS